MSEPFKPGQTITCTLKAVPRAQAPRKTITRLMQMDPAAARALKRAQKRRRDSLAHKPRGGRMWAQRTRVSDIVSLDQGRSWNLVYSPTIAPDLRSVSRWVDVSAS